MEQRQIRLTSLLPSLCALFIIDAPNLYSQILAFKGRFEQFTAHWDALPVLAASLCLIAIGAAVAVSYGALLTVWSLPYYATAAAIIYDFHFLHRPLTIYVAALFSAVFVYRSNHKTRDKAVLVTLLFLPFFPVVAYNSPWRFLALAFAVVFFVFALIDALKGDMTFRHLFDLQDFRRRDFSVDCLVLLTVGGFAWSQAAELLGAWTGTLLYLPMAVLVPGVLSNGLARTVALPVWSPKAKPILNLGDFIKDRKLPSPSRWNWEDIYSYLSTSTFTETDEDHEIVREKEHLFLGVRLFEGRGDYFTNNEPVLLDRKILSEHLHILGRSGSNKTTLGILPIVTQLIRGFNETDGKSDTQPIVIIDLKGDPALFHTVKEEAEARGQKFLFFTAEQDKPSYFFNPFSVFHNQRVGVPEATQSLLDALNLNHGEGYGRSYFTRISRQRLMSVLQDKGLPTSFQDLYQKLSEVLDPKKKNNDDAFELQAAIESFLLYPQLFTTPEQEEQFADTIINFDRVLEERQVVYFWLPAQTQSMAAREIGKLVLFNLFSAAKNRQDQYLPTRQVCLIIDEFQRLVGENLTIILEQARSYGIGAILSNHSSAQLKTADGKDLWPLINGNTAATIHFGSKDIQELEMLSKLSGEFLETHESTSRSVGRGTSLGPQGSTDSESYSQTTSSSSHYVQKFMIRDLQRIFSRQRRFILSVQRNTGLSNFDGAPVVVDGIFTMPKETYIRRKTARWPEIPNLPEGLVANPKAEFIKPRPLKEMTDKIRMLTQES